MNMSKLNHTNARNRVATLGGAVTFITAVASLSPSVPLVGGLIAAGMCGFITVIASALVPAR